MPRRYSTYSPHPPNNQASQNSSLQLSISSIAIIRLLGIVGLGLIFASSIGQLYQKIVRPGDYGGLINLLYIDAEKNFPTAYSFLMLIFCSILLAIIALIKHRQRDRYTKHWQVLAILFFFLAIDEFCAIHELTIERTRQLFNASGIFYFAWVIPAIAFLSVLILTYLKFILSLPNRTKFWLILSGTVYILGAIGMELIGGYRVELYGYNDSIYIVIATIEEMLEMTGTILFIYTLLEYLKPRLKYLNISIDD